MRNARKTLFVIVRLIGIRAPGGDLTSASPCNPNQRTRDIFNDNMLAESNEFEANGMQERGKLQKKKCVIKSKKQVTLQRGEHFHVLAKIVVENGEVWTLIDSINKLVQNREGILQKHWC